MTVRTKDHPAANGRKPQAGDVEYRCAFPLESGEVLIVCMGQAGFDNTTNLLMDMLTGAPPHSDGSVNDKDFR